MALAALAAVLAGLPATLPAAALSVDLSSREESRQFFRAVYAASEGVPLGFTGDTSAGRAGDTSSVFKEAVRLRVNFFRAFAGIPGEVAFSATFNAKCQQAALVAAANNSISHSPPSSARFYSAEAAEAAGKSNLALISNGPEAITNYIRDAGANVQVGHRRWVLYPQTREMGSGDVPSSGSFNSANALWILDANAGGARPATRQPYVAWPPAGYVPYPLVFPRWSFSVAGADFSQAFVSVRRGGAALPVKIDSVAAGFGENTIVWSIDNQDPAAVTTHPRPSADTAYAVEVTNVLVGGGSQSYRYTVTVFDPDQPAPGTSPLTPTGPASPVIGQANPYRVTLPAFFGGAQWRSLRFRPVTVRFDAEGSEPLGGLRADTGPYAPVVTDSRAAGAAAYRLIHPAPVQREQTLTLPETYFAGETPAVLTFASRLGYATARQLARVQVSTDDGTSWSDVFVQAGNGSAGETAFRTHTVTLDQVVARTFRVRFNYTFINSGTVFTQTDPGVGWYLDDIALTGVRAVTAGDPAGVTANAFSYTPADNSEFGLQVRGVLQGFPAEWGTVVLAFAGGTGGGGSVPGTGTGGGGSTGGTTDPAPPALPPAATAARLVNLSVRTTAGRDADALVVGFNLAGTGTKPVLIRAVGPTLGVFGVAGALADPLLRLDAAGGATVLQNDNWGGAAAVAAAAGRVGAFALDASSRDAAVLPSLAAGSYTVQVTPATAATAPGGALVEVYDAEPTTGSRLANVSARAQVGTGGDILVVGFAVGGTGTRNVLIRAVGPTLAAFGVGGTLADPKLEVIRDGAPVATSDNWNAALSPAFATVGAFALTAGSRDAALALALAPGTYTAQVSGVGATTGVALVEVYELP